MLEAKRLFDGIHWVGAVDWNVRHFHGHSYDTHRGTSYNAYFVQGEKTALIDAVHADFKDELLERVSSVIDISKLDYLVMNHGEKDHSGAIPDVLAAAPKCQLVCSKRGLDTLGRYFGLAERATAVSTGDSIDLGGKTLVFNEAPMLHWPDSMFTYVPEDELLMPNDAFGQHIASSELYCEDEDMLKVMDEAAKYYANILMPFAGLITKKLAEVSALGILITTIAPSHGLIWRNPATIIDAYARWSAGENDGSAVVVYETMWGATEKVARALVDGLEAGGMKVKLMGMPENDRTEILAAVLEAGMVFVGSSVHNSDILLNIAALLEDMRGLRFLSKKGVAFGSYGWSERNVKKSIEERLEACGMEVLESDLFFKWAPDGEGLSRAREYGLKLAGK